MALKAWQWLVDPERGQGFVEYALCLAFISIIVFAALSSTGQDVNRVLNKVAQTVSSVT